MHRGCPELGERRRGLHRSQVLEREGEGALSWCHVATTATEFWARAWGRGGPWGPRSKAASFPWGSPAFGRPSLPMRFESALDEQDNRWGGPWG